MDTKIWHQQYDAGVRTTLDYPALPVDHFLRQTAQTYKDKPALLFGGMLPFLGDQHSEITYGELDKLVDRFAAGLQQMGIKKSDRVALYMPNCPQYVIAYYGCLRAGAIIVPCNPLYVGREVEHLVNDSGAKVMFVLSLLYKQVREVRGKTKLEQVIVANIKDYFPLLLKTLFTLLKERKGGYRVDITNDARTDWFEDFLANAPAKPQPVDIKPEDSAILMYTGGTTGVPKGAELTHRNIVANAFQVTEWMRGGGLEVGKEIMLTSLPLTHCYSMTASMNLSVFNGFTQVLIPNPRDFQHLLNAIEAHQPTLFPGVPTLYTAIINNPDVKSGKYSLNSIKACISGAAGLPVEVQRAFQNQTGAKLVEGYGLSEATPVTHCNPVSSGGRIGYIGVPMPDTDVILVDPMDEVTIVGPDTPGVLCIHGPQVMKGYWNKPTETTGALRKHPDGKIWLHTGDIAVMTEDGYFKIVDRKKDMILAAGGLNVYPRDIEERLYEHPKVQEAVAIGVPVGGQDQRAKMFVVLKTGETMTTEEIIDWCKDGLAHFKVPKYVEFRKELPKTAIGKILRRTLIDEEEKKQKGIKHE